MPGALPEIIPSPDYDPFADFRDRAMFMQAWSSYGIQWPVIADFLGVEPNVPAGRIAVVPHVPDGWPGLAVRDLRVGGGAVAARAGRHGDDYVTKAEIPAGLELELGHVLPDGAEPTEVRLDGRPVEYRLVDTDRGREVVVDAGRGGRHELVVSTN